MIMVYFHQDHADSCTTDEGQPEFPLPDYIPSTLRKGKWAPFMKWDYGLRNISPIDFVDQAGDHSHFHTLHAGQVLDMGYISDMGYWVVQLSEFSVDGTSPPTHNGFPLHYVLLRFLLAVDDDGIAVLVETSFPPEHLP